MPSPPPRVPEPMSVNHDEEYLAALRIWIGASAERAAELARGPLVSRPCPVCASSQVCHQFNNGNLDYGRCEACGHVFMNPWFGYRPVDYSGDDELMNQFFEIMQRYRTSPFEERQAKAGSDRRIAFLRRHVPEGARLLDVGCSTGEFLDLAALFYEVSGLEPNEKTWAIASRRHAVHHGYVEDLPGHSLFDVVTLNQILYGIKEPAAFLRGLVPLLRSGGRLYINTPNADSWAVRLFGGRANHFEGFAAMNVFTSASLLRLAEDAGLRLVTLETEWLDVYLPDLLEWLEHPSTFIHKRNVQRPDYIQDLRDQDGLLGKWNEPDFLGERGNYLVALFEKP